MAGKGLYNDAAWRALRARKLAATPWCECDFCAALHLRTRATVVDHVKSVRDRPDLRLIWSNLRSMAKRCHDRRTMADQGPNKGRVSRPRMGCDEAGMPLDPKHPWRR